MASKRKAKKKPAKTGRPRSEMTQEIIDKIVSTVALGVWPDRAAMIHGVKGATMRAHKARNPSFATALEKAEATAEAGFMAKILRHTEKQWTAAAWMLERRWPDRWAKREVVLSVEDVVPDRRFE